MKSKIPALLLSLVVALGLWLYVVTTVSPESEDVYYNIPVVLENESALRDKGLMLVSGAESTVTLRLYGNRSDLNRLDRNNITVTADLSKISEPGEYNLNFNVSYPYSIPSANISILKRNPSMIAVSVAEFATKDVPVTLNFVGNMQEGLIIDRENAALNYETVTVSGPKEVIDQIDHAGIEIDRTNLTESIDADFVYTLQNADNEPVDVSLVTTNVGQIHLQLPVEHYKEIPLRVELIPGGGATAENATVTIDPEKIAVSGSEEALANLDELVITSINLAEMGARYSHEYPITLPENITNRSGVESAKVTLALNGLGSKTFTLTQFQPENVPEGLQVNILTQKLDVVLRGPGSSINGIALSDITATVDLQNAEPGTFTVPIAISVAGHEDVGAYGKYSISITVTAKPEQEEATQGGV